MSKADTAKHLHVFIDQLMEKLELDLRSQDSVF